MCIQFQNYRLAMFSTFPSGIECGTGSLVMVSWSPMPISATPPDTVHILLVTVSIICCYAPMNFKVKDLKCRN